MDDSSMQVSFKESIQMTVQALRMKEKIYIHSFPLTKSHIHVD